MGIIVREENGHSFSVLWYHVLCDMITDLNTERTSELERELKNFLKTNIFSLR